MDLSTRPRSKLSSVGLGGSCPNRNGDSLFAVPGASLDDLRASRGADESKADVLQRLRANIAMIERGSFSPSPHPVTSSQSAWTLGETEIDRLLGGALDEGALHEVKAEGHSTGVTAGDWVSALGFALRLGVRRLEGLESASSQSVLWCWTSQFARELGTPYGHGLAALGLKPSAWLLAETARTSDALWAMEEGLRSQSLALVIGVLSEAELTPARRLSLVAAEHSTPCLLVTDPRLTPAGSTATRWRVGRYASAVHAYDTSAPGAVRYRVMLERCRYRPLADAPHPLELEWSDETHRFHMAAAVADRAHAPRRAGTHAG